MMAEPADRSAAREWTPAMGVACGAFWGLLTGAGLGGVVALISYLAPTVQANFILRVAESWGVAWVLWRVVTSAAGMAGALCNALVLLLTLLVLACSNAVFAVRGVPTFHVHTDTDTITGWDVWFGLSGLLMLALPVVIGGGVCVWRESAE